MILKQPGIAEHRKNLINGTLSPSELLENLLKSIEQTQESVGSYLTWDAQKAREEVKNADLSKPLGGIPILLKDNINAQGQPCTCASKMLNENYTSPYDAFVSQRLKEAGAILVGRANMDEFAMGSSCENSALGQTSNPHDLKTITGGSSGGSAAAVAAGAAIASLGSDTGGSIRQPASHCGVIGMKPSYGRVSRYGLVAFASSLDQIGPFSKTVEDAALLLNTISGYDPRDATSLNAPVPDYTENLEKGVKGLKLGLPKEFFGEGVDPEVRALVTNAVKALEKEGAELVDISLPHTKYSVATYYIIAPAEASSNLARFDGIRYGHRSADSPDIITLNRNSREEGFGPEVKRRIILGTYALSSGYYDAYYNRAQKVRAIIQREYIEAFSQVDAILTPVSPKPARLKGVTENDPLADYLADIFTISANLAGIPAISIPCGAVQTERETKLPVGLQIMTPHLREDLALQISRAWERI